MVWSDLAVSQASSDKLGQMSRFTLEKKEETDTFNLTNSSNI